jgi:hypothetical protein
MHVNEAYMDALGGKVKEWEKRYTLHIDETEAIEEQIKALLLEARQSMDKIKFLNNETAIKFIEDVVRIEKDVENLQYEKSNIKVEKPLEMKDNMLYTR